MHNSRLSTFVSHLSTFVSRLSTLISQLSLPIAMLAGVLSYVVYRQFNVSPQMREMVYDAVAIVQPLLLFVMLFLSFCKINPVHLRIRLWHVWLALIQAGSFVILACIARQTTSFTSQVVLECAMCCMICPTATAAVVITDKLGGNKLSLVTYTIISNLVTSIAVPLIVPMLNTNLELSFWTSFLAIIKKVFPLLVFPFLLAWGVRVFFPRLLTALLQIRDLAFYFWIVALALAMAVTAQAVAHSDVSLLCLVEMLIITMVCCLIQFLLGKRIGGLYEDRISGGQALGQKNTVFMIWMGASFLNPVTAISGGLYSIWHNTVNSYQLYKKRKATRNENSE